MTYSETALELSAVSLCDLRLRFVVTTLAPVFLPFSNDRVAARSGFGNAGAYIPVFD